MSSQIANSKLDFVNQSLEKGNFEDQKKLSFIQDALTAPESESNLRYAARGIAQIGKGIAKATVPGLTMEIAHAAAPYFMATPEERRKQLEQPALLRKERNPSEMEKELQDYKEKYEKYQEWVKNMPTVERLSQLAEEKTGLPLSSKYKEQEPLELAGGLGKLASGNLLQKAATGTIGGTTTAGLQAAGVSQPIADIAATFANPENITRAATNLGKKTTEILPSGLSKPKAIESKFSKLATVSKERKLEKIKSLNEEAGKLAKESVEKRLPITKKIAEGFDFKKHFDNQFGKIQNLVDSYRPEINVDPLNNFISKTKEKYSGIPNPHGDAKLIQKEIRRLERSSYDPNDLSNQLKIYRSNNKKKYEIFEKARTEGKKEEYVDWLTKYNDSLRTSIKNSFPSDSPFVKLLEGSNREYAEHLKALDVNEKLKSLLGGEPTPRLITKLAEDPKAIKKLSLSMGEEGAKEISQIAKDLKLAKESIKAIPTTEIKKFDAILPLGALLDLTGITKGIVSTYSAVKFAQYGYGRFLMSSKNRRSYSDALKAIIEKDPRAYAEAISHVDETEKE